jgi:hypothetical protein
MEPRTFTVGGEKWRVVFCSPFKLDVLDCLGTVIWETHTIYIRNNLIPTERNHTLLHEILHITLQAKLEQKQILTRQEIKDLLLMTSSVVKQFFRLVKKQPDTMGIYDLLDEALFKKLRIKRVLTDKEIEDLILLTESEITKNYRLSLKI